MDKTIQQILENGKHLEKWKLTYQSRGSQNLSGFERMRNAGGGNQWRKELLYWSDTIERLRLRDNRCYDK